MTVREGVPPSSSAAFRRSVVFCYSHGSPPSWKLRLCCVPRAIDAAVSLSPSPVAQKAAELESKNVSCVRTFLIYAGVSPIAEAEHAFGSFSGSSPQGVGRCQERVSGPFAFANRKSDQKGLEKGPSVAHALGCFVSRRLDNEAQGLAMVR